MIFLRVATTQGQEPPTNQPTGGNATPPTQASGHSLDDFVKSRLEKAASMASKGVNGLRLGVRCEIQSANGPTVEHSRLLLHWTLTYNGPRQPLISLRTTLAVPLGEQCVVKFVRFIAGGAEETAIVCPVPPPIVFGFLIPYGKEAFLTLPHGATAQGVIVINANRIQAAIQDSWGKTYTASDTVYAQIRYAPHDRGDGFSLDAWTGDYSTALQALSLQKLGIVH